ncbi:MAG: hypothetical protein QM528_03770 [Phycisphaerales bacterium]|nr:hypothetical protein [Phycisphaerales bacterium]
MDNLDELIFKFLSVHSTLSLYLIGQLEVNEEGNSKDILETVQNDKDNKKHSSVVFTPNPKAPIDEAFLDFVIQRTGKPKSLCRSSIEDHGIRVKELVNLGKPYTIDNVGVLNKKNNGVFYLVANFDRTKSDKKKIENRNNLGLSVNSSPVIDKNNPIATSVSHKTIENSPSYQLNAQDLENKVDDTIPNDQYKQNKAKYPWYPWDNKKVLIVVLSVVCIVLIITNFNNKTQNVEKTIASEGQGNHEAPRTQNGDIPTTTKKDSPIIHATTDDHVDKNTGGNKKVEYNGTTEPNNTDIAEAEIGAGNNNDLSLYKVYFYESVNRNHILTEKRKVDEETVSQMDSIQNEYGGHIYRLYIYKRMTLKDSVSVLKELSEILHNPVRAVLVRRHVVKLN